jgi:hypothetical protein
VICSNERILTGPAARGGYFFGEAIKPERDPSLTLFARDDNPDRILVFFEETMSPNCSAAQEKSAAKRAILRERYIYFTASVKLVGFL